MVSGGSVSRENKLVLSSARDLCLCLASCPSSRAPAGPSSAARLRPSCRPPKKKGVPGRILGRRWPCHLQGLSTSPTLELDLGALHAPFRYLQREPERSASVPDPGPGHACAAAPARATTSPPLGTSLFLRDDAPRLSRGWSPPPKYDEDDEGWRSRESRRVEMSRSEEHCGILRISRRSRAGSQRVCHSGRQKESL